MTAIMVIKVCALILQIRASFAFAPPPIEDHGESGFKLSFGYTFPNVGARKDRLPSAHSLSDKGIFTKRFCTKVKLRPLTKAEDVVNNYDAQDIKTKHFVFAEKHEEAHDEEYEDNAENAETDLEEHLPGCGPPTNVEAKILNKSAFQLSWLTQTPQVVPVKYFILEYEQAKKENEPVTKCRQWVEYKSDDKNATFTHHIATVEYLITDHKYQFQVESVYNDYQTYPAPKTPWIYLPGDGQAPRVTHPPGFTPEPFPAHW